MSGLSRQQFVTATGSVGLGLVAGCGRLPWQAQPPAKVYRLGVFHVGTDHVPPSLQPLRAELHSLGYEEGTNIHLDWRNLDDEDTARAVAQEFVRDRVDLIVAFENQTIRAARAATATIPIVFLHPTDPVAEGFVVSFAHPGGNITGITTGLDLTAKRLEVFRDLVPDLQRVLILWDPIDPVTGRLLAETRLAADTLQLPLVERAVNSQAGIERVFGALQPGDVDGVFLVSPDLELKFSALMLRLTSERHLPMPAHRREWVEQGALFSYGPNFAAAGAPAARYIDRILKGTNPGELPVEQLSRFEFVLNLKTARALGITFPQEILQLVTEVIP